MPNIKKNVRNSTYIALGACAIGFTQITKKGEMISTKLGTVKKQIKPKVETTAENISNSFSKNSQRSKKPYTLKIFNASNISNSY